MKRGIIQVRSFSAMFMVVLTAGSAQGPVVLNSKYDVVAVWDFGSRIDSAGRLLNRFVCGLQLASIFFRGRHFEFRGFGLENIGSRAAHDLQAPLARGGAGAGNSCASLQTSKVKS